MYALPDNPENVYDTDPVPFDIVNFLVVKFSFDSAVVAFVSVPDVGEIFVPVPAVVIYG